MRSDPDGWLKALMQRRAWARDKDPRGRDKDHARAPTGGCADTPGLRWSFRFFCQILKGLLIGWAFGTETPHDYK